MFAKAMDAAGQSVRRFRGWIGQLRRGNTPERTENPEQEQRTTFEVDPIRLRHPYFFESCRSNSEPNTSGLIRDVPLYDNDDAQRRRGGSLPTGTNRDIQEDRSTRVGVIFEGDTATRERVPDQTNENETHASSRGIAVRSRHERCWDSNQRFQNTRSMYSVASTEMSGDSGFITDTHLQPSFSSSQSAVGNLSNEPGLSQSLDGIRGRSRQNSGQFLHITKVRKNGIGESGSSLPDCGSDDNLTLRERQVSICSITKIMRAIVEVDGRNDFSSKHSVFIEEVHTKSCDENTLQNCNQSVHAEKENDFEETGDLTMPQDLSSDVMSRGPITGRVKLCLQHFEASRVLRVIILRASNLKAKKGDVYAKLSVQFVTPESKTWKVLKLAKQKASSEVSFNEQVFFDNIDEDHMERLTLSVRLYNREGMFRPKRCLGEMVIPLFKYDLSMDTNVKGYLREQRADLKNLRMFDDDGDLEVISEDRSIAACVAARMNKPVVPKSPRFKRMSTNTSNNLGRKN